MIPMLTQTNLETIAVQLVQVTPTVVTAKTETNQIIEIKPAPHDQHDHAFWQSLKDIAQAKIWLPVTKGTHELLQHDWLSTMPAI
ncbi:hypothetical protein FD14_GL001348 [Secundilactobacillus similis DSM 23365 = JCM 2765]|uniref:Uncharacterized protein n=2 Tax=Secundilactobacillus similis TaxID=414682 RepID=A0A0R2EY17_9LACO|nr:hypothetical protein FD14_GL001348 [Secundilactobacillus similis DSM 23365 = JCM 2765]